MRALELGKGLGISLASAFLGLFLSQCLPLPVSLSSAPSFPICFSILICHNIDVSCGRQHLFSLLSAFCFLFLIVKASSLNIFCSQGEHLCCFAYS